MKKTIKGVMEKEDFRKMLIEALGDARLRNSNLPLEDEVRFNHERLLVSLISALVYEKDIN